MAGNVEFDMYVYVARRLKQKYDEAKRRGLEFNLTFTTMKNLLRAKRCYYTGVALTRPEKQTEGSPRPPLRPTDLTIDRVDSSKGYVIGNVVACCNSANNVKAMFENPDQQMISMQDAIKLFTKTGKRMKKK